MQVGITGHQDRRGIDWDWVGNALRAELRSRRGVTKALSSLAAGSDQVFARAALSIGIPVMAVIPMDGYERFFAPEARKEYEDLVSQCEVKVLNWVGDERAGFFAAGKFIVDNSDLLFAVWDGEESKGLGGTANVVTFAVRASRQVVHFNPITKRVVIMTEDGHG
ncbi:hypothetical protein HNQ36_002753 [Afipia massiliensis]|uniref:DUF2493 domain-containing protein n=1 Tax=Afipia massiliensis TaxID=211460 RepID=A0A840MWT2_9BRAD|nr:hypothetical protein [Afipia massiliensis]MBB5052779.1 hypothetical protein [Afipia massiliensis]